MTKTEVWQEFLDSLLEYNIKEHHKTKEYEYFHKRFLHIDEMLTTNLTKDEKVMVEEVLFELGLVQEYETRQMYEKGMKDCVLILKNLGAI